MILEQPVINLIDLETQDPITFDWVPWLGSASVASVQRGGSRSGSNTTVDVGTLIVTLVNTGDPLTDERLRPNLLVRLISVPGGEPIFTGRIVDLDTLYRLNKITGELDTFVTLSAVDAVTAHVNTIRYGAVTPGGVGFESWAQRIIRLATSSVTAINPPEDDSPIVKYAI